MQKYSSAIVFLFLYLWFEQFWLLWFCYSTENTTKNYANYWWRHLWLVGFLFYLQVHVPLDAVIFLKYKIKHVPCLCGDKLHTVRLSWWWEMYDAHSLVADDIHLYVFFCNNKFIDAVLQALFLIEAQYSIQYIAWTVLTKDALKC